MILIQTSFNECQHIPIMSTYEILLILCSTKIMFMCQWSKIQEYCFASLIR